MYNVLIAKENGRWFIQFSDWDKDLVTFEFGELRREYKRKDLRIFTMDDDNQIEIDRKVEWYNRNF